MNNNFPLTLLYDGACPVCNLEMDNLKARNSEALLKFVDISVPFFDPVPYGASLKQMNGLIHAMRPDGQLVVGVEVFRLAYGAVGLGHLTAPTGWPLLRPVFDIAYAVFAKNRYGFSAVFSPLLERVRDMRASKRKAAMNIAAQQTSAAVNACHEGRYDVPTSAHTNNSNESTRSTL